MDYTLVRIFRKSIIPVAIILFFSLPVYAVFISYASFKKGQSDPANIKRYLPDISDTIPDDYIVYEWRMGTWFKMPIGFRNGWMGYIKHVPPTTREAYEKNLKYNSDYTGYDPQSGEYRSELVTKTALDMGYNYCMPSKRYFKRHYYTYGKERLEGIGPCEVENDSTSFLDYPVAFTIKWPFVDGAEKSLAARSFINNEKTFREKGHYIFQNMTNSEHNKNGPISGDVRYHVYESEDDLSVNFSCWEISPTSICRGSVWVKSENLIFDISLPFDKVQIGNQRLWEEPVLMTVDLIKNWRE